MTQDSSEATGKEGKGREKEEKTEENQGIKCGWTCTLFAPGGTGAVACEVCALLHECTWKIRKCRESEDLDGATCGMLHYELALKCDTLVLVLSSLGEKTRKRGYYRYLKEGDKAGK